MVKYMDLKYRSHKLLNSDSYLLLLLLLLFSFGLSQGMRKFPGQGLNLNHINNQSHSSDNAKSLVH